MMNSEYVRTFRRYLKDRDLRMTLERLQIAKQTATFHTPFTAEHLRDALPTVSRATIYRTLGMLVDAGLLKNLISSNGLEVYAATSVDMGGMMPPHLQTVKQALRYGQLCAASHSAVIVGTCPWCGAAIIPGNHPVDSTDLL